MFARTFCLIGCFALVLNAARLYSQEKALKTDFSLMFLNTENFFDSDDEPVTEDEEFTPEGDRHWTKTRFWTKAGLIAKEIVAAGEWNAPVCIGLCEVENLSVLQFLTETPILEKFHYKIVHKESPDKRGIDVGLIYRPELFAPFEYEAIQVADTLDPSFKTRDILRVSGVFNKCDTLHVFVNHWPSRSGGIMDTQKYRRLAAEKLKAAIEKLMAKYHNPKIICMGDFNDTPVDESVGQVLGAKSENSGTISGELVNLSYPWMERPVQTIKSQYTWSTFDQIIVSDYFLDKASCYEFVGAEIFEAPFLLEADSKFGGVKPKRTYVGMKYQEGFSDHLPVLLKVRLH